MVEHYYVNPDGTWALVKLKSYFARGECKHKFRPIPAIKDCVMYFKQVCCICGTLSRGL